MSDRRDRAYGPLLRRTSPARRGVVLIVILGLLAVLALLGVSFALLAGSEEQAARHYQDAARRQRPELEPRELFLEAIGQLVADTDNPRSAIRGHSLLRDMYGNDNDLYDEQGRPYPDGRIEPFERYQRAFNGPGEKGPDGVLNTQDDTDVNYVFNRRLPERDPANPARSGGFDEDYDYPDHQNMFLAFIADGVIIPSFRRPGLEQPDDWTRTDDVPGRGRRFILRPRPAEHPAFPTVDSDGDRLPDLDVDNDGDGIADSVWVDIGLPVMRTADGRKFKPLVAYLVLDLDGRLNLNVHGQLNADKLDASGRWVFPNAGDNVLDSHADVAGPAHTGIPNPPLIGLGSGLSVTEINLQNVFSPDSLFFGGTVYSGGFFSGFEYRWLLEGRLLSGVTQRAVAGRWGEPRLLLAGMRPRPGQTAYGANPADDDVAVAIEFGQGDRVLGTRWRPYITPGGQVVTNRVTTAWFLARWPMDYDGDGAFWVTSQGQVHFGTGWRLRIWGSGSPALGWPAAFGEELALENVNEADEMNVYDGDGAYYVQEDRKFTPGELESLLRWGDVDHENLGAFGLGADGAPGRVGQDDDGDGVVDNATELGWPGSDDAVSGRLPLLAASLFDERDPTLARLARRRRRMLTTESWDLISYNLFPLVAGNPPDTAEVYPVPPPTAPPAAQKLVGNGRLWTPPPSTPGGWGSGNGQLAPGLAWTPGADGAPGVAGTDDDGDGVVDELDELGTPGTDDAAVPAEIAAGRRLNLHRPLLMPPADRTGLPYWATTPVISSNDPRALARDIYLLLRLLRPTADPDEIRRMAQFAVNVVDFMDPDDVMTAFEYDVNLSDGWNVDGNIGPTSPDNTRGDRALVWGVERPQVVINETLAFETEDDGFQLWFELYNPNLPTATDPNGVVDLAAYPADTGARRPTPVYEVVLASAEANDATDPVTGEPNPGRILGRLVFQPPPAGATASRTRIEGGQYLLAGPASVDPAPVSIPQIDFDTGAGAFNIGPGDASPTNPPRRRLYLRRLAHPGHPHDPQVNPYITIDCLEVRGWSREAVVPDPNDPNPQKRFRSIERLEPYSVQHAEHSQNGANDNPHSLANSTMNVPNENNRPIHTALFFYDHPVATPFELLLVPACPMPWLTTLFSLIPEADQIGQPLDFYNPAAANQEDAAPSPFITGDWEALDRRKPFLRFGNTLLFGYLLDFFYETPAQAAPTPGWHRLFEFLEVASRMNGSRDPYHGPARDNRRWRVPGKVNLNTVADPEVFLALLNNHPWALSRDLSGALIGQANRSLLWRMFLSSRVGPDGRIGTADDLPFRSFRFGTSSLQPGALNPLLFGIQATLFRSEPAAGAQRLPLLEDRRQMPPPGLGPGTRPNLNSYPAYLFQPLFKLGNIATTRSHVFAVWITVGFFEVVQEDFPAVGLDGVDNDNDGLIDEPDEIIYVDRLGPELGTETGQVIRHRAFFIVDRSRADGWPGPPQTREELLDTLRKVVLLSRIIE